MRVGASPRVSDREGQLRTFAQLRAGIPLAPRHRMEDISKEVLAAVHGGMRWEDMPRSENVEDRRGMTPRESMSARSPRVAPLPPLQRSPGDLSSQAGLDDMKLGPRRRR